MLEPNSIVFYVDNLAISSHFYEELLSIHPEEPSPTFKRFRLSNGMVIGLKNKKSQAINITGHGGSELAFTVSSPGEVDKLHLNWQQKGVNILEKPTTVCFGYTFIATDPDGNRLRVVSLGE